MDSADLSGLSESDQDDLQAAMQRIAGNLQPSTMPSRGTRKAPRRMEANPPESGTWAALPGTTGGWTLLWV